MKPAVAAVMLAALLVAPARAETPGGSEKGSGGRVSRADIERTIEGAPDYVRFFDRLRLVFPSDYEALMSALAEANAQAPLGNADSIMNDAYDALRRARGRLAAEATDAALDKIFAIQRQELQVLARTKPDLCLPFLQGASNDSYLAFAAGHRALVADAAIAGLDAMSSGRIDKVRRAAPSDEDFRTIDAALVAKGLSRPEIGLLLDSKSVDPPIADDRTCEAGQIYLETLEGLPADARHRLYGLAAELMAKSAPQ